MKWATLLAGIMLSLPVIAEESYYTGVDRSSAATLRESLHAIIDDHQRYPYTSLDTDTWDVLESADEDIDNSNHIITVYRNASFLKRGGGNDFYNREHTWPRSYGFPDNDGNLNYPFTDMHNCSSPMLTTIFSGPTNPMHTVMRVVVNP